MPDSTQNNSIYRQLNADMRDGLKNIYHQASKAGESGQDTEALFSEAGDQLDEVVKTTEKAAMEIMEIVERQQDETREEEDLLAGLRKKYGDSPKLARLAQINATRAEDLENLLTALSFQDITGQRIQKVAKALAAIENSVLELYLSSGLMMEAAEKEPEKDAGDIKAEAKQAVEDYKESCKGSQLKGPAKNPPSQAAIDDLLAQLGL